MLTITTRHADIFVINNLTNKYILGRSNATSSSPRRAQIYNLEEATEKVVNNGAWLTAHSTHASCSSESES